MYTCALHIKLKNSPKIYLFLAVNGKRIRDLIPWPPGRMYFETQMAGEFSMPQILLKLGVKWPLVKAFQLH